MKILVINAGSSSLKYQLFNMTNSTVLAKGLCERIGIEGSRLKHSPLDKETVIIDQPMKDHKDAITMVLAALTNKDHGVIADMTEITAVGHRVVHGGELFSDSAIIDADVMKALEDCCDLAPLHNPPNIVGIKACQEAMPNVPEIAVFDTAFHQTMPPEAYLYAIPYELYEKYKIRRYGFHGTSHKYVAERAAIVLGKPLNDLKIVTCHLGNGSSITGIQNGKSVATSMGFTPLAGVLMGTRSGTIDPAIVTYIMDKEKLSFQEVNEMLNKESGAIGISGISSDFRDLYDAEDQGSKRAKLAIDMFAYAIRKYIGQYAALMGGIDAVVFTAGIGENNSDLRLRSTQGLGFLGLEIDAEKNKICGKELDISTDNAKVRTLVIPTNEELSIALETKKLI
ncbi:MAG: acetate kinase [Hyphomonadaceae bacterium]|nr:acetate kinase [Clostridia bacterium]